VNYLKMTRPSRRDRFPYISSLLPTETAPFSNLGSAAVLFLLASLLLLTKKSEAFACSRGVFPGSSASLNRSTVPVRFPLSEAQRFRFTKSAPKISCATDDACPEQDHKSEKDFLKIDFLFLVHGYKGSPSDLSYLQSAVSHELEFRGLEDVSEDHARVSKWRKHVRKKRVLFTYAPSCNHRRTDDGIKNGGERLLGEITDFMAHQVAMIREDGGEQPGADPSHHSEPARVTFSIVGNSMGGLYSRYAVSKLIGTAGRGSGEARPPVASASVESDRDRADSGDCAAPSRGGYVAVDFPGLEDAVFRFDTFCSTCSPHLGTAGGGNTYVPMPRWSEKVIGRAMGKSLEDM